MRLGEGFYVPEPETPEPIVVAIEALTEMVQTLASVAASLHSAVGALSLAVAQPPPPRTRHVERDGEGNITRIVEE